MIDDSVLHGRIPRLGTITTGYGVEATSRSGNAYGRPTRSDTLVFHTNDGEVADAVQRRYGGDVRTDSPNWEYDVVTDVREIEITALAAGFRQALELWRAAECLRRCDGVTMSMADGRPASRPCLCEEEMARGQDRACSPSTILPALMVEVDVDRFGVWEVRSTGWGTAAAFKGAIRALEMVGAGTAKVPAVVAMVDRKTRDADGRVHEVTDLHLTLALGPDALSASGPPTLPAGTDAPAIGPGDRARVLGDVVALQTEAVGLGLRDRMAEQYRQRFAGRTLDDLDDAELATWLDLLAEEVEEHRAIVEAERSEAAPPQPPPPDDPA
jgi:hypothetical protein